MNEYSLLALAMFEGAPCSYCGVPLTKDDLFSALGVAPYQQGIHRTPVAHPSCYQAHNEPEGKASPKQQLHFPIRDDLI